MVKALSFFAGAGGLDIGLEQAGFDIGLAVELMPKYVETVKTNNPKARIIQGDVMDFSKERIYREAKLNNSEEVALMVGGSPCQSFSTAGKRLAFESPGGQAMLKFAELVTEVRPRAFLLENVKGLLSAPLKTRPMSQQGEGFPPLTKEELRGGALAHILTQFPEYEVVYKLLNAADYGVPQKRERVFLVGIRKDLKRAFVFPEPSHSGVGMEGKKPWVTIKDVFADLEGVEHHHTRYSEKRLHFMKMIPKGGGNWRDLPKDVTEKALGGAYKSGGGKVGYFRRLHWNRPSPTVLTSPAQNSTNLGHPEFDRPLSIEEYLAIQEFPKGYVVAGSLNDQYTQIGNAVPIRLAKVMGEAILRQIEHT